MLAAGDPVATALFSKYKKIGMPNLRLAASEGADLMAFLEARGGAAPERARQDSPHAR